MPSKHDNTAKRIADKEGAVSEVGGQMGYGKPTGGEKYDAGVDDVFELADVAGPIVLDEVMQGFGVHLG